MSIKLTRRQVLRTGTALGAGMLANPLMAQDEKDLPEGAAGKLTVIQRQEYFQAAQDNFRTICEDFSAANGASLDISTTNAEAFGDFLGKMSAAVRAGNPPDVAYTSNVSISQMKLLDLLEDMTDIVDEATSLYGDVMTGINAEKFAKIDGRWWAVPFIASTTGTFMRGDKLEEAGIDPTSLTTWDARRDAALAISDPDNGFYGWGLTVNQSGDGWGVSTGIINAFLGHFTDESGTKVTFNSPETVAAYEWVAETYDRNGKYAAMLPPGVESWGDISNNEAYLAGQIGYTHNAFSVYAAAKRDENPVFEHTLLLRQPDANNGDSRDGGQTGGWLTVFKGSQNADLARKLVLDLLKPENFNKMSSVAGGLFMPAFENQWTDELIAADANFAIIKEQVSVPEAFIGPSWPANPNAAIDAIRAQGIVEQSMGNVIAGRMDPAEAVADAHKKMVELFEEGGLPQD